MKNKLITLLTATTLFSVSLSLSAYAADDIKVILDGKQIEFDVPPQIINDRTMVPMRAIFEALGADVEWYDDSKTAVGSMPGVSVSITINDDYLFHNNVRITIDTPAQIVNERTLIPLRAVSECFGVTLNYDNETKTVTMNSTDAIKKVPWNEELVYYGEFSNNTANGYGALYKTDTGDLYKIGLFSDGKLISGRTMFDNGSIAVGTYEDDMFIFGQYYYSGSGDKDTSGYILMYEGEFSGMLRDGYGTAYYSDGAIYEGNWNHNVWDGNGIYYHPETETNELHAIKEELTSKNGMLNGYKYIYLSDGSISESYWEDNKRVGNITLYEPDGTTAVIDGSGNYISGSSAANSYDTNISAYMNEMTQLQDWYIKEYKELDEMYNEIVAFSKSDPYKLPEAKSILKTYGIDADNAALNAAAGSASSNGGNIDSFAAANAQRQKNATLAKANEAILNMFQKKLDDMREQYNNYKDNIDKLYETQKSMIEAKYGIFR